MKRTLVIDDLRSLKHDAGLVVYARTALEGLRHLKSGESWDVLYLDHDLGAKDDVRAVVRYLEEKAFNGEPLKIGRIILITMNPVGSKWIIQGLERYYSITTAPSPLLVSI